jgi:competence protein ComEC
MPTTWLLLGISILNLWTWTPPAPDPGSLNIYYVDVEGGAATLIVAPSGESLLIDTGWPRPDARDAKRIRDAMRQAGVRKIDHLLITHYHRDHWGGVEDLAKLAPIAHFYDHGRVTELADDNNFAALNAAYGKASHDQSTTMRPGSKIPVTGLSVRVLSAAGATIGASGDTNPACADAKLADPDPSDNARSVGVLVTFGKFRFLDLGDLTWNVEQKLVCPVNAIGPVELYQVTHHGMDISNNPVLLASVKPHVAIMNNGPVKGGSPATYARLVAQPGLDAIFQVHRNVQSKDTDNTAADLTANLGTEAECTGNRISVSVAAGGAAYTVTNGRTNQTWSFNTR